MACEISTSTEISPIILLLTNRGHCSLMIVGDEFEDGVTGEGRAKLFGFLENFFPQDCKWGGKFFANSKSKTLSFPQKGHFDGKDFGVERGVTFIVEIGVEGVILGEIGCIGIKIILKLWDNKMGWCDITLRQKSKRDFAGVRGFTHFGVCGLFKVFYDSVNMWGPLWYQSGLWPGTQVVPPGHLAKGERADSHVTWPSPALYEWLTKYALEEGEIGDFLTRCDKVNRQNIRSFPILSSR